MVEPFHSPREPATKWHVANFERVARSEARRSRHERGTEMCGQMSLTFCKRIRVVAKSWAQTGHVAVLGLRSLRAGEGEGPWDLSSRSGKLVSYLYAGIDQVFL